MRAASLFCTLVALGCGSSHPCSAYRDNADLHGYCLSTRVLSIGPLEEAARWCASGEDPWVGECRSAWVFHQIPEGRYSTAALLDFCQTDDCRFMVMDRRPSGSYAEQFSACKQAGRYQKDCEGHVRQRCTTSGAASCPEIPP